MSFCKNSEPAALRCLSETKRREVLEWLTFVVAIDIGVSLEVGWYFQISVRTHSIAGSEEVSSIDTLIFPCPACFDPIVIIHFILCIQQCANSTILHANSGVEGNNQTAGHNDANP